MSIYTTYSKLVKPNNIEESVTEEGKSSVFSIYPIQRGFGVTIGNILRRVLLSSIRGSVIASAEIDGAVSEFDHIPNIVEDVSLICLNLRKVVIKSDIDEASLSISATGPCVVTAGMIEAPSGIEIVNKDHVICRVSEGGQFVAKLKVKSGIGPLIRDGSQENKISQIIFDCYFSPIRHVNIVVDSARFDKFTDYDKLTIDIKTNGSITPKEAINVGSAIVRSYMEALTNLDDSAFVGNGKKNGSTTSTYNLNLLRRTDDLELSVRSANCLNGASIKYIGDLIQKTEAEMLKMPNFGRKSLDELRSLLNNMNLNFGCDIGVWPPQNMAALLEMAEKEFDSE